MSNILIFKLLFLIILIIFTIYILYYECKFKDINNKGEILQSVIRIPKPIRDLIFIYGSGTLTYYQILKGASQENISKVKDKEISELKEEIGKLKDINNEERNQYVSLISNLIGDRYQIRDLVRRQEEFIENIDMINQLKEKKEKEKKSRTKKVKQIVEPIPSDYPTRVDTPWKIGAHVSAAGGVENAILNAAAIGYEIQS